VLSSSFQLGGFSPRFSLQIPTFLSAIAFVPPFPFDASAFSTSPRFYGLLQLQTFRCQVSTATATPILVLHCAVSFSLILPLSSCSRLSTPAPPQAALSVFVTILSLSFGPLHRLTDSAKFFFFCFSCLTRQRLGKDAWEKC